MVTMQKIAELCGVSRGTVDRALNGRGRVNHETAELVKNMAKQLGYEPNPAGKALSARKTQPVIGIVLSSEGNAFFDDVIHGIQDAAKTYEVYGMRILMKKMKGYDVATQAEILDKLRGKVNALIINPINDEEIVKRLSQFAEDGVFVIHLNNDLPNSNRHCYVGCDFRNGGKTACALLEAFRSGPTEIGVILGDRKLLGHRERVDGFMERMESVEGFHVAAVIENEDDEICSFERTKTFLREHRLDALYLAAGGVYGACRAVEELEEGRRPLIIAHDSTPSTIEMMEKKLIKAVIYQHPYRQGHTAVDLAFEYIVNGRKPKKQNHIMKNEIKLLENL